MQFRFYEKYFIITLKNQYFSPFSRISFPSSATWIHIFEISQKKPLIALYQSQSTAFQYSFSNYNSARNRKLPSYSFCFPENDFIRVNGRRRLSVRLKSKSGLLKKYRVCCVLLIRRVNPQRNVTKEPLVL